VVCGAVLLGWAAVILLNHDWSPAQVSTVDVAGVDAVPLDGAGSGEQSQVEATEAESGAGAAEMPATDEAGSDEAATETAEPGAAEPADPESQEGQAELVVHVTGAVARPGIVLAEPGSRVYEVIALAGGQTPAADLAAVNLAAAAVDGQQLHIPAVGEAPPAAAAGTGRAGAGQSGAGQSGAGQEGTAQPGSGSSGAKINLNTATVEELDELPRVGPVLAERIVQWRQDHGNFGTAQDLDAVPGIGPAMMEALMDLVTV
jgi:competence protein ComEA